MKTRRLFLVILAFAGILTACSNDESLENASKGQEISFRMQGGTPTSILRTTASTGDNVDAFVVFGTDDVFWPQLRNDLIFDGVTVARTINGNYEYANKKYFGEGATIASFIAFSPVSTKAGIPIVDKMAHPSPFFGLRFEYEVPVPEAEGKTTQEDLLVARTSHDPQYSTVQLDFTHALSRVFVTAVNHAPETVIIHGLTLKNLIKKGTVWCSLTNGTAAIWTPSDDPDDVTDYPYVLAETGVAVPGLEPGTRPSPPRLVTSMEQGMMLMPQATRNENNDDIFDPGDFALEVQYTFANTNFGIRTKHLLIEHDFPFAANTQYVIKIIFEEGAGAIDFTIDVTDFQDIEEPRYP